MTQIVKPVPPAPAGPPLSTDVCDVYVDVVEAIGKRWTAAVLAVGAQGARRFAEYRRRLAPITPRVLTRRLRELEEMGLVERIVVPSTPVQITYRPTGLGLELLQALQPLIAFGHQRLGFVPAHRDAEAG